jgi:NADH-quinone oxidoreductase subunit L
MFVALGDGHPDAAMFHLMTHAFFKALLFLAAGSVIIGTHHNQEMDKLGGLWRKMPVTAVTFLAGSLALAAVPFFSGFWSKDEIFHSTLSWNGGWATFLLGFAAILTAIYTTRLFIRTFLGQPQDAEVHEHARETGPVMLFPLIFLAILAVVSGFVVFNGVGKAIGFPGGFTEFVFLHEPERFHMDWAWAGASAALAATGIFLAGWLYWGNRTALSTRLAEWQPGLYDMLVHKFYFDELYQAAIDRGLLGFSFVVSWFDRYVINDTGVDGMADSARFGSSILKYIQTGKVPNYALGIALGAVGLAIAGLVVRG